MALTLPTGSWFDVMKGARFDAPNDSASNEGLDLVGDANNALLQSQRSGASSDEYWFRVRLGDNDVKGVSFYLALDITGDSVADIFVEAQRAANGNTKLAYHKRDASKSGTGPNTTGWLNSTNDTTIEKEAAAADCYVAVSSAGTNIDNAGGIDSWLTFGFKLSSLQSFAPAASLTGSSAVVLYAFTSSSQTANGDIAGINGSAGAGDTWASLGLGINTTLDNITTTSVTAPPDLTGAGGTLAVTEGDAAAVIDSSLTVQDTDSANLASATVTISAGYVSTEDVLSFTNANGITGSWDSTNGVLALSGSATLATYQAALESVKYQNTNTDNPNTSNRTISWVVNDGTSGSAATTSTISVSAVNDPPTLDNTKSPALSSIAEDAAAASGTTNSTLVSALVSLSGGIANASDVDEKSKGEHGGGSMCKRVTVAPSTTTAAQVWT